MNNTKKLYRSCAKIEQRMKKASGTEQYYIIQSELNEGLKTALNSTVSNWAELTKDEILHLISMCSSYRPQAPFSILVSVSMQYDKIKLSKSKKVQP